MLDRKIMLAAGLALAIGACSANGNSRPILPSVPGLSGGSSAFSDGSYALPRTTATSVLKLLTKQVVIGSTVDPLNGDVNPYGFAVDAYMSFPGSKLKEGNLYVCNFNAKSNVQGTGTTIVTLAPKAGSKPARYVQSSKLLGCAAIAIDASNDVWAASFGAKSLTDIGYNGKVKATYKGGPFVRPFGVVNACIGCAGSLYPTSAIFDSDASTGAIVKVEYCPPAGCTTPKTAVISGFAVNHGQPGSILGPSGLVFDPYSCPKIGGVPSCGTLYVVDGVNNTVVAINNALNLTKPNSIVIGKDGKTFSGPEASWAKLVYAGKPLNGPISAALVYNKLNAAGNVVVGNTLDPSGTNLLIELSGGGGPGKVLDTVNVDKGAAGALFGMQATGIGASTIFYFNDDNANNVQALQK